jgi:hypothetical protein
MQLSIKKIVSLSVIILISIVGFSSINSVDAKIQENIGKLDNKQEFSAYDLFKAEPTNPTQILKLQRQSESLDPVIDQSEIKQTVLEDDLDDVRSFWIIDSFLDFPYNYIQVSAKMLAIGTNCYVYVINSEISSHGESNARTRAENWRDEFENKIYPNDLLYFGNPDGYLGDIDGDSHLTILLADLDGGVAGYFDPNNEYAGSTSNSREMVYVDYDTTYGVLAHEHQHLIHYNYDTAEYWWVDEGCAEYAKYLNDYDMVTGNLTVFARDYFAHNPDDSLLYWNYYEDGGRNVRIDYGGAYTMIFYIAEKYGNNAIKDMVSDTAVGPFGIENALQGLGHSIAFNDVFLNWATALMVDDTSFGSGIYGYQDLDISVDYDLVSTFPIDKLNSFNSYYGLYIAKLTNPPDYLMFDIESPTSYSLGISIAVHDTTGWSVQQSIQTGEIIEFISGTLVDTVYVITSIMMSTTPTTPLTGSSQFGLGYDENLDYSLLPGSPLYIDSYSMNYLIESWDFSLTDVYIEDENGTAINDTSNIDVFAQFKVSGSTLIYANIPLNYSPVSYWYVDVSLQSFDEEDYEVAIIASGSSQYGRESLGLIEVQHVMTVELPTVNQQDTTSLYVYSNATYTQLNAWTTFTEDALARVLIYDSDGTVVEAYDMVYNPFAIRWESSLIVLDTYNGEFYVAVRFSYAGRSVLSPNSDTFIIEGEVTPTNTLSSPYIIGILLFILGLSVPLIRRRYKK